MGEEARTRNYTAVYIYNKYIHNLLLYVIAF